MRCIFFLGTLVLSSLNLSGNNFLNFVSSCTEINLDTASILANCSAANGGIYKSALRLRGINNVNGILTIDDDSSIPSVFYKTCKNMGIDDYGILSASCKDASGRYRSSSIDLSDIIKNYNGTLVYPLTER